MVIISTWGSPTFYKIVVVVVNGESDPHEIVREI